MVLACTKGDMQSPLSIFSFLATWWAINLWAPAHRGLRESVSLGSTETQQRKTYLDLINIERYFQS